MGRLRSQIWRYLPTIVVLGLGFSTTIAATAWVGRWERLYRRSEFRQQTQNLTTALQRTTNRYTELLSAIGDLYQATEHNVDAAMFQRFVARSVATYPGIQALEWAPEIADRDRAAYEQQLGTATNQQYTTITERDPRTDQLQPAARRDRYVPVTFLEPFATNEAALGYDLASDITRRTALEQARDTGHIAATGRIQLVQETRANQYGFLVFVPIYQPNFGAQSSRPTEPDNLDPSDLDQGNSASINTLIPESITTRKAAIKGYVLGVFRMADVVEESLQDLNYTIEFYILDQTAPPDEKLLGYYSTTTDSITTLEPNEPLPDLSPAAIATGVCPVQANCTQTIQVGQRQWQLVFLPSPQQALLWRTLTTAVIGMLLTSTVLIYVRRWQAEIEQTRQLSELKLRLFSMASHELRTPLSVISISAQSLVTHPDTLSPTQQQHTLNRIQLAAQRLGQLVEDMLTLSRAEAGKLEFNPEIVAIAPLCQQVVEQIQLKPGQEITLKGNALETQLFIDKRAVHAILINLLVNASKYSPEVRPIELTVNTHKHTESRNIELRVCDRGQGIEPADQPHVCTAFYRGQNTQDIPGTGLGLAVVKTCVDLHGGTLAIRSEVGQGTCVTVQLPWVE